MIRILKFARKRWYTMVLIITLLLGQAYCELTLPQYTSNIVDVGIQYKGIERTIPEAVRPETFQGLLGMISDSDEKELVQDAYELIEKKIMEKSTQYVGQLTEQKCFVPTESRLKILFIFHMKVTRVDTRVMCNLQFVANNPRSFSPLEC